jgi:hypothetical protein
VTPIEHLPRKERGAEETPLLVERADGSIGTFASGKLLEKDEREPKRADFRSVLRQRTWDGTRYRD